jgi:O-methyltransferase/methyltransferase family protein
MSEVAPDARLWDALRGALVTRTIATVVELRVAEALAEGPRRVEDLARASGADADALRRLLRALASDGIFAEDAPGVFRNTAASDLLRGGGWSDFARLFGGVWYRTVGELDASGTPVFEPTFGADFWTWLGDHPDERAAFDRAMGQGGEERIERLAALEWRGDETVVDVGGGNGSLLAGLLALQPGLRGIVLDLPETNRDETALGERIAFVPGSFFEQVPRGDAYVLSTILHDWDDESASAILRTIRAGAPAGARVLLIVAVVGPGNERDGAKWLDLLMLALFGGRERDATQWRSLIEGAGLRVEGIDDGLVQARCP